MLELLTCVKEAGTPQGCCTEKPYSTLNPDCVELCLIRSLFPTIETYRNAFLSAVEFGIQNNAVNSLLFMQDVDLLKQMIILAFKERIILAYSSGAVVSQDQTWASFQMSCWVDYFRCKWNVNIRPWLLEAGFYDPAAGVPQTTSPFYKPFLVTCGEIEVLPAPSPLPWPPDCSLDEPDYWVDFAIDASVLATLSPGVDATVVLITSDIQQLGLDHAVVGQMTVWNGVEWVPSGPLPDGITIQVSNGTGYFQAQGGVALPVFPSIIALNDPDSTPCTITLISSDPAVNLVGTRGVLVEASIDGSTWDSLLVGVESQLATPYILATNCSEYTLIRVTYFDDQGCVYPPIAGIIQQSGPPENLTSFELRAESMGVPMAITSYPATHPIHFVDDEQWTLSFWYRSPGLAVDDMTPSLQARIFTMMSSLTPGAGVIMSVDIGNIHNVGAYVAMSIGRGAALSSYVGFFLPDTTQQILAIDPTQWHHYCIVRNGPLPAHDGATPTHHGSTWKLYVDGGLIADASLINFPVGPGFLPYPTNEPAQGLVLGSSTPYSSGGSTVAGDLHLATIDEIYLCKTARTDLEVNDILMKNLMQGSDTLWDRILWWRADGDNIGVDNVNSNQGTTPNATMYGNVLLNQIDLPPIPS